MNLVIETALRLRWVVLLHGAGDCGLGRLGVPTAAHRRLPRHLGPDGADHHRLPRPGARGRRAPGHDPRRERDARGAPRRDGPLADHLRPVAGADGVRGGHRGLLGPAAGHGTTRQRHFARRGPAATRALTTRPMERSTATSWFPIRRHVRPDRHCGRSTIGW